MIAMLAFESESLRTCGPDGSHAAENLLEVLGSEKFGTILADPPWRFTNRTGKIAPEYQNGSRYSTMALDDIKRLPVMAIAARTAHLYLWIPNALLYQGLDVMEHWGFEYKTNIIWYKIRKDGGPDRRGVGFYFRNVTEIILFSTRGKNARTLDLGRSQENIILSRKREHSRKPDEQYSLIEGCSPGPFVELFARTRRDGWSAWGDEIAIAADGEGDMADWSTEAADQSPHVATVPTRVARFG